MHSKYYYIGDYKEGRKNGQGIDYVKVEIE